MAAILNTELVEKLLLGDFDKEGPFERVEGELRVRYDKIMIEFIETNIYVYFYYKDEKIFEQVTHTADGVSTITIGSLNGSVGLVINTM